MGTILVGMLFAFKRVDGYVSLFLILEGPFQPFPAKSKFLATHEQNETYTNNSDRCCPTGGVRLN